MSNFLDFRTMVSTEIIKFLYIVGAVVATIGGGIFIGRFTISQNVVLLAIGLLMITLGNLLWRMICESWILLFSIHEILGSIEENLVSSEAGGLDAEEP